MNILIIPGTNGCASEIINSLATMKGVELYGGGSDLEKSRDFPYKEYYFLPDIMDKDAAIAGLTDILSSNENSFDLVFFTHDQWIYEVREIPDFLKTTFIRHNPRATEIASFKSRTYAELKDLIKVPKVYSKGDTIRTFPVYAKPDRGQGSRGGFKIDSGKVFEDCLNNPEYANYIYTEFLSGSEFTIDCFSGIDGRLLYARPRVRSSISGGIALGTEIVANAELFETAKLIGNHLKLTGAWFFQMKEDVNHKLTLLEVGLRSAGASGIQRLLGVNQSMAWIYQTLGNEVRIIDSTWSVGVSAHIDGRCFQFDREISAIFVDFDDTLIVDNKLNAPLLNYLRKSRSNGVHVALISRHKGNLPEQISMLGLAEEFDRIIHIVDLQPKSSFMKSFEGNILFIDDSFSEREEVSLSLGANVLALDQSFLNGFIY